MHPIAAFVLSWQDVLVAVITVLDILCGCTLAVIMGYRMLPIAIGLIVGAIASLMLGSLTPVYVQIEETSMAFRLGKDLSTRISMILLAALLTLILGILGLPQAIVNAVGPEIFAAVLCGVGLYLTKLAVWDLTYKAKGNGPRLIGVVSIVTAVIVQLWTNDLIKTIAVSVPLCVLLQWIMVRKSKITPEEIPAPKYNSWLFTH